jgi:hypothetical protein
MWQLHQYLYFLQHKYWSHNATSSTPLPSLLGIIGTGDGYAVASKGGMGVEGAYLWDLKEKIDREWMAMYQVLPSMDEEEEEEEDEEDDGTGETETVAGSKGNYETKSSPEIDLVELSNAKPTAGSKSIQTTAHEATNTPAAQKKNQKENQGNVTAKKNVASMSKDTIELLKKAKMRCTYGNTL